METADRFAVRLVEKHDGSEHTLFSGDGLGRHTADAALAVILLAGVESELKPLVEDGPSHAMENATVIGVERTADNPTAFTGWADKTPAEWGSQPAPTEDAVRAWAGDALGCCHYSPVTLRLASLEAHRLTSAVAVSSTVVQETLDGHVLKVWVMQARFSHAVCPASIGLCVTAVSGADNENIC